MIVPTRTSLYNVGTGTARPLPFIGKSRFPRVPSSGEYDKGPPCSEGPFAVLESSACGFQYVVEQDAGRNAADAAGDRGDRLDNGRDAVEIDVAA